MSITNTNAVAKIAAVVAGLGLVAMSFASFAPAAKADTNSDLQAQLTALLAQVASLQAQLGMSQGASTTFTRDLTIGATGADVTALQNWLLGKSYAIPAGATGYFGSQTQAAVARFQVSAAITPAAGYFGPITRAKVNAMAGGTMTGGTTTVGGVTLSGGEASLTSFNLIAEDGTIRESQTKALIATAQFDVKDGDADIQRLDFEVQANNVAYETHPWKYFKTATLWAGSTKLASMDVSNQDAWNDNTADSDHAASAAKFYKISFTGFHHVVKEGTNSAELTIAMDTQSSIDVANSSQTLVVDIPTNGIRAVDSLGINQYVGTVSKKTNISIDSAQNGKLTISEDSSDPDAGTLVADTSNTSPDFTVFAFKAKNSQSVDSKVTDLTFTVAHGTKATNVIVRRATLTFGGKSYDGTIGATSVVFNNLTAIVPANSSAVGTVKVSLYSDTAVGTYSSDSVLFSLGHANVTAENASNGDSVASTDITGTATGNTQSVVVNGGITVAGVSMTGVQTYNSTTPTNSYGTFTLKFNVTAVGDDVFVPQAIDTTANTSGHTASTTSAGVMIDTAMSASTTNSVVTTSLSSTADTDGALYVVHAGDTETFTATVTINPLGVTTDLTNFQVGLDKVKFSTADSGNLNLQTLDVDQTQSQYRTDSLVISG